MTLDRLQYSMDEAARLLSMSRRSLERMAADGELKTIKPRGRRFVPATEIERLAGLAEERSWG